jgi:hypothetical protein
MAVSIEYQLYWKEVRKHHLVFGTKENQCNIHYDARKIIAQSEATQHFVVYWDLITEAFWKFLENLFLRGGKEGYDIL